MNHKIVIKLGAGKGKLLPVLQEYLKSIQLPPIDEKSRRLVHTIETPKYILEITLLRWEDLKRYSDQFDMIIYGSDQWLEAGDKSMVSLKYFEQKNCRISLLVKKELENKPFSYFKERKVATSYENLAKDYLGIKKENIVKISGSVEAAVLLGWADSIFDIVETGKSAKENGLVEYKTFVKFGAILATKKIDRISLFEDLGLIEKQEKGKIIAFDGVDGSGKSTIAKYLVQNPIINTKSKVLITPYSGHIGQEAKKLWDKGEYIKWATTIGKNHWRAPEYVNSIYDRSILTFLTDLIKTNNTEKQILDVIQSWSPLPDILFFCDISPKIALERSEKREIKKDEFDKLESLKEYNQLYEKAIELVEKYHLTKVVRIDTNQPVIEVIEQVEKNLKGEKNGYIKK